LPFGDLEKMRAFSLFFLDRIYRILQDSFGVFNLVHPVNPVLKFCHQFPGKQAASSSF